MVVYFKKALKDKLLFRIVFVIWGVMFISIGIWPFFNLSFANLSLLYIFPILLLAFGSWLVFVGLFKNDKCIDKYMDLIGDGGDILAVLILIVVILIALPIREIIKRLTLNRK